MPTGTLLDRMCLDYTVLYVKISRPWTDDSSFFELLD